MVLPSTFAGDVVCGSFPIAWKTYVARLTDVTQSLPFAPGWSDPVPCLRPVSFSWGIPGHQHTAETKAYDRDDIEPALGFFDEDVLDCPRCHARWLPIAVIRQHDVIDRILRHLALPPVPAERMHPSRLNLSSAPRRATGTAWSSRRLTTDATMTLA